MPRRPSALTSGSADSRWLQAVSIEPMRPEDLDSVLAIERASFPSAWSRESYVRELRNPCSYYIVAWLAGEVIGYAGMWVISGEAHISTLAVLPTRRRRGLGSYLLSYIIAEARRQGTSVITLEVRESNIPAQALYRRFGFQSLGLLREYYGDTGENGILMQKRISAGAPPDEAA
jgi:ribosomal-protein-alanine N-acetyltransferase